MQPTKSTKLGQALATTASAGVTAAVMMASVMIPSTVQFQGQMHLSSDPCCMPEPACYQPQCGTNGCMTQGNNAMMTQGTAVMTQGPTGGMVQTTAGRPVTIAIDVQQNPTPNGGVQVLQGGNCVQQFVGQPQQVQQQMIQQQPRMITQQVMATQPQMSATGCYNLPNYQQNGSMFIGAPQEFTQMLPLDTWQQAYDTMSQIPTDQIYRQAFVCSAGGNPLQQQQYIDTLQQLNTLNVGEGVSLAFNPDVYRNNVRNMLQQYSFSQGGSQAVHQMAQHDFMISGDRVFQFQGGRVKCVGRRGVDGRFVFQELSKSSSSSSPPSSKKPKDKSRHQRSHHRDSRSHSSSRHRGSYSTASGSLSSNSNSLSY